MANFRLLSSALAILSVMTVSAQTVVPGAPSLSMSFGIEGDSGKVTGTVTAPKNNDQWTALPADTRMDLRVVRSCYALGETEVPVFSVTDLAPGETCGFADEAEPAWQYGYQYTYLAYASIDGAEGYQGYGSCQPGVPFAFGYGAVSATPGEKDGRFFVDISAVIPDKTSDYPPEPLEIDMTALEIYRVTDISSSAMELIGTVPGPEKGSTCHFVDESPVLNKLNYYYVKCVSRFGFAQLRVEAFVGQDVPSAPYPVVGEMLPDGGYRISWTAPSTGANNGAINPEETVYNVYRCWGRAEDEREMIASGLKDTEYVDYGTDMDAPRAVMYMVEAANAIGVGGSSSSSYSYDVMIGPDYRLPYVETFDGGASKIWTFANTSYYAGFDVAAYAEYGDNSTRVEPVSGTGLVYVDFSSSWIAAGSNATMTSYRIDLTGPAAPALSFYAYMIPGCDVVVKPQISVEGGEFVDLLTVNVGEGEEAGWKQFCCDLSDYAGKKYVNVRFFGGFSSKRGAAIIDEIRIVDYPAVSNIEVSYDSGACTATLTWEDPSTEYAKVTGYEGFVNGESVGDISMPWIFKAEDYKIPYVMAVKALYGEIAAPESNPVTVSVPRPVITEFTIDEHVFSIVLDAPYGTHEVVVKKYLGTAPLYKAPQLITYDDVTYEVTGIAEAAYCDNGSLVSVNLADSMKEVGAEAFAGCSNLMAVAFGSGLEKIGQRAFAGCSSLVTVTFVSEIVPEVADDAFEGIAENCVGKCPAGMENAYGAVEGLSPIEFGTAEVEGILIDGAEMLEYYNMNGLRLVSPMSGEPVIMRLQMPDGTIRVFRTLAR